MFERESALTKTVENQFFTANNITNILSAPFVNFFFPWFLIILVVNKNNWGKPIIYILIFNYVFRVIGDIISQVSKSLPSNPENNGAAIPVDKTQYLLSTVLPLSFWIIGECIGDWYSAVRTGELINSKSKYLFVKLSCLFFNLSKMAYVECFWYYNQNMSFRADTNVEDNQLIIENYQRWWILIIIISVFGFLNSLSIIIALKSTVSNKIKLLKSSGNSVKFMNKFRQIPEYRIIFIMYLNCIVYVILIPYICIEYANAIKNDLFFENHNVNLIREFITNFNHTMMYVDQLIIKYMADPSNVANLKRRNTKKKEVASKYNY